MPIRLLLLLLMALGGWACGPQSFLYTFRGRLLFMAGGGLALLATPALRTEAGRAALAQLGKFMITASFAMVYQ